jgi:hypothetical protein
MAFSAEYETPLTREKGVRYFTFLLIFFKIERNEPDTAMIFGAPGLPPHAECSNGPICSAGGLQEAEPMSKLAARNWWSVGRPVDTRPIRLSTTPAVLSRCSRSAAFRCPGRTS